MKEEDRIGFYLCPFCMKHYTTKNGGKKTKHHIWKLFVFSRTKENIDDYIYCCERCHQTIERAVSKKENKILRQYPEIYAGTFNEFLAIGIDGINEYRKRFKLREWKR